MTELLLTARDFAATLISQRARRGGFFAADLHARHHRHFVKAKRPVLYRQEALAAFTIPAVTKE
jgi:hypothetical protein